jgi:hypothetical protein
VNTPASLDAKLAEERVLGWRTKLHRWAGQDEQQRFGDLFNLVCDPATLLDAWERVKRNRGSRTAVLMARPASMSSSWACKVSSPSSARSSRTARTVRCRRASG